MKEYESNVSFIQSKQDTLHFRKEFVLGKPKSFHFRTGLKNWLIQKLLNLRHGTLFISGNGELHTLRIILEQLKKERFVVHYGEGPVYSDYPKFRHFGVLFVPEDKADSEVQRCWGHSPLYESAQSAVSRAFGECLERHASYYTSASTSISVPKIKHGDASHLYEYVPHFTQNQKNEIDVVVRSSEDLKNVLGFHVRSITNGRKRFLPFETMYWGKIESKCTRFIQQATTNGCGGGSTYEQAFLSAFYELIERDHFFLHWFAGIHPHRVSNETLPSPLAEQVKEWEDTYHLEICLLDISYDMPATVIACVVIDPILNLVSVGAKAASSKERAFNGAMSEALAVLSYARDRNTAVTESRLNEIIDHTAFTKSLAPGERMGLYSSLAGINLLKSVFLEGKIISYKDLTATQTFTNERLQMEYQIEHMRKFVRERGEGYHTYVHEFTSKLLRRFHYRAVRVYIPAFLKLHLNEVLAAPVSHRLTEFAAKKGKVINSEDELNRLPHFFS